jgi:hypothetical protein
VWDDLNERTKDALAATAQVRVYQSVNHALLEIGMSFQVLYSHKRQYLVTTSSLGTHCEDLTVYLSRQGIKSIQQELTSIEPIDDKKTLFWVLDVDDAITAQKYLEVSTPPSDTKVFRIFLFHHQHLVQFPDKNVSETDIYILSHPETGGAVALFGRRAQNISSFICSTLNWEKFSNIYQFPSKKENKAWVENMEKREWQGSQALLKGINVRLYDRAILTWTTLDGGALRQILIDDYKVNANHLESLSLYRWLDTRLIQQYGQRNWTPEQLRGTLILSSALSEDSDFENKLESALQKLKQLSHF